MNQKLSLRKYSSLTVGASLLVVTTCTAASSQGALSAETTRPNNSTFVLGEKVSVTFQASGLQPSSKTALAIKVSDELGTVIATTSVSMNVDSSGQASTTYAGPSTKLGYYRLDASLPNGTAVSALGTRPAGFVTYAVVSDPSKRVNYGDAGSRFGMQGGFSAAQGSVIPYLGVRYVLASPDWGELEPKNPGQFAADRSTALAKGQAFPPKSAVMDQVTYNGAAWPTYAVALVTKAKVPSWALEPNTSGTVCKTMGALNSAGVQALPAFAQAFAEHVSSNYAAQSMHYYEVTWEPAKWCFGGSAQQLVQFYQLSYAAIHRADPKAIVMGPTLFPEVTPVLTDFWAAGGANYLDAVSIHPYVKFPPETNDLVSNIRTQMQLAQTAKGHSLPFVGTEHGYTSSSIGELNEALGDIRATIILLGEGFKFDLAFYIADFWSPTFSDTAHYYGYYWNLNPKIAYGTDKIGPKPVVPAYAAMTSLLDGTTASGPIDNLAGTQMGYRFQRNGTTILALWDYQAASSSLSLAVTGANVQVCNWMNNCASVAVSDGRIKLSLGAAPVYVVGQNL
jgi:hypothetical protein